MPTSTKAKPVMVNGVTTLNGHKTMEVTDLFAKRVRAIEIQITDDPADAMTIKYKPDALTKRLRAEMTAVEEDGEATMAVLLNAMLAGWSLTVDGEPYPVNPENLEALGLPLMSTFSAAIMEDFSVNVALGKSTPTPSGQDSNAT